MKLISMRPLLMALVTFTISMSAHSSIESLVKRQSSSAVAPSSLNSSVLHPSQTPTDQQLNLLQGNWRTACEVDGPSSSQEVVTITGNTLRRVFGIANNTTCQAPPDILGIQTGRITIGREISNGVFEIDWTIEQSTLTPLSPGGAADLNEDGGFCGLKWGVNITRDTTACLGPFVNQYSAFTVTDIRFVWGDRTANQPGTTPETRSTDLNSATKYSR